MLIRCLVDCVKIIFTQRPKNLRNDPKNLRNDPKILLDLRRGSLRLAVNTQKNIAISM